MLQKYAGQTVTLTVKAAKEGYGTAEASAQIYVEPLEVPTPQPSGPTLELKWVALIAIVVVAAVVVILLLRRR